MTPGLQQLLSTPTPAIADCVDSDSPVEGAPRLDDALYLRRWLLDLQMKVDEQQVVRHRMLKAELHALCFEAMRDGLSALVDEATEALYERLLVQGCEIPDSEPDADPEPWDLPDAPADD